MMNSVKIAASLVMASALATALVACSGASDQPRASRSPHVATVSETEWQTALAGCMRGKGHDFGDPQPGGGGQQLQIDGDDAKWRSDYDSCSASTTKKLGELPVSDADRQARQDGFDVEQRYAECLRGKGYSRADPVPGAASGGALGGTTDDNGTTIDPAVVAACDPTGGSGDDAS